MKKLLRSAEHYCNDPDTDVRAIYFIHKMLEYIEYLHEQDEINTQKLKVCRTLNQKYRKHVLKLIDESEHLDQEARTISPSNFIGIENDEI